MPRTVTWLHLSDLHACKPQSGWDAARVIETLGVDLRYLRDEYDLHPDFLFFTGDLAFGQLGKDDGKSIAEQFLEGEKFLSDVRMCFDPVIEKENVFLVPGNHDVDRTVVTDSEKNMLQPNQSLERIEKWMRDVSGDWKLFLGRLSEYKKFLSDNNYQHCLKDSERLIYTATREAAGLSIGIAGFNTAWSSTGAGPEEQARLWAGGRFQLETLRQEIRDCEIRIALIHHPGNWLVPKEQPRFFDELKEDFEFVLHGHEHNQFVRQDASNGHTTISAGACHEWSDTDRNGYSITQLNLDAKNAKVWLREYYRNGWRARELPKKTDTLGIWHLNHVGHWIDEKQICAGLDSYLDTDQKPIALDGKQNTRSRAAPLDSMHNSLVTADATEDLVAGEAEKFMPRPQSVTIVELVFQFTQLIDRYEWVRAEPIVQELKAMLSSAAQVGKDVKAGWIVLCKWELHELSIAKQEGKALSRDNLARYRKAAENVRV